MALDLLIGTRLKECSSDTLNPFFNDNSRVDFISFCPRSCQQKYRNGFNVVRSTKDKKGPCKRDRPLIPVVVVKKLIGLIEK